MASSVAHAAASTSSSSSAGEGTWVLVGVEDDDGAADYSAANASDVYQYEGVYERGSYTGTGTYVGETDTYPDPDWIQGESMTTRADISPPPEQMAADETVEISLSISVVADTHSYFDFGGGADVFWGSTRVANADGDDHFHVVGPDYVDVSTTLLLTPGTAAPNDQQVLTYTYNGPGADMHTSYTYEFQVTDTATPTTLAEGTGEAAVPTPVGADEQCSFVDWRSDGAARGLRSPVPQLATDDSGIRFSDLSGEVMVRPDADRLAWGLADLGMVLYYDDHVRTERDSSAILSLTDLTTFVMKPCSEIILNTRSERENKLLLLSGKVWANVKKMVLDGSMDVEMSQAAAGIKGTTFALEDDGETSTVKVFEGTVSFTSHRGEQVDVTDGQAASADSSGQVTVTAFDVDAELAGWPTDTRTATLDAIAASPNGSPDSGGSVWPVVLVVLAAGAVAGLVVVVLASRRRHQRTS